MKANASNLWICMTANEYEEERNVTAEKVNDYFRGRIAASGKNSANKQVHITALGMPLDLLHNNNPLCVLRFSTYSGRGRTFRAVVSVAVLVGDTVAHGLALLALRGSVVALGFPAGTHEQLQGFPV